MNLSLPNGEDTFIPAPPHKIDWVFKGRIATRQGIRFLHVAPTPNGWWDYWKENKEELKPYGFACTKDPVTATWQVQCWIDPNRNPLFAPAATNPAPRSNDVQPPAIIAPSELSNDKMEAMSRADKPSPEFKPVVPAGVTPYDYQIAGVEYALQMKRCLIGDDMGLGKTLQAIMVCNHTEAKSVLVACPASLRLNWMDEWGKFSTENHKCVAILSKSDLPEIADADVVFISYDILASKEAQALLRARCWDVVIADEAHYLKNHNTKRAYNLLGLPPRSRKPKSDPSAPMNPIPADRYIFLTGTPVSNRPIEFWNILRFCSPSIFGNYTKFAHHFCAAKQDNFGLNVSGASNLHELQSIVRSNCMVRRLKPQVLKQLPSKTRKIIALPAPDKVKKEIDTLTFEYVTSKETIDEMLQKLQEAQEAGDAAAIEEAALSMNEAKQIEFDETAKVRKIIGLCKADLAVEHLINILESSDTKIIVGAHHKDVVKILFEKLAKYNPVLVTGDVSPEKRHVAVQRFQTVAECRVFIGNILAAGTGLTLTASPHVVIVEPDWVPANNLQFEDRAHRIGQAKPVLIEYLAMDKTIDIQILRSIARKMDVIDKSIDRIATHDDQGRLLSLSAAPTYNPNVPHAPSKPVEAKIEDEKERARKKMLAIKFGQSLSPRELLCAHECCRHISKLDNDRASVRNNKGFSKFDSEFGKHVASQRLQDITDYQRGRMAAMIWKYRGQCPENLSSNLRNPKDFS